MPDLWSSQATDARKLESFRFLQRNGTNAAALNAFEAFISAPGVLERPSLIVRCRFAEGAVNLRIVVERQKSERRLRTQFEPFAQPLGTSSEGPGGGFRPGQRYALCL
jgi:hypothetical protein